MLLLRMAWILGFLPTREYHCRTRRMRFGASAPAGTEAALRRLERSLASDRIAVVLFLIAAVLFVYTWAHGPLLTASS